MSASLKSMASVIPHSRQVQGRQRDRETRNPGDFRTFALDDRQLHCYSFNLSQAKKNKRNGKKYESEVDQVMEILSLSPELWLGNEKNEQKVSEKEIEKKLKSGSGGERAGTTQ